MGEFGLINLLAETVGTSTDKQLIIGIGDDAAAWQGDNLIQLATTDSYIQDIHFSLDTISWPELGWKVMASSLSDIAAMGGVPRYVLVSLGLPPDTDVNDTLTLYQGMLALTKPLGVAITGGETTSSPVVMVTITVLGTTRKPDAPILTRSAAQPGEKLAITGTLGAAAAGLKMLSEKLSFDTETTRCLKDAFVHPIPRLVEGEILVRQGVRAAIDISDGLLSDLNHICQQSRVGARIETSRVLIAPAVKANFGDQALELALSGGEDYELIFTASPKIIDHVTGALPCPVTVIGETTADKDCRIVLVDREGKLFQPAVTGWEHFTHK